MITEYSQPLYPSVLLTDRNRLRVLSKIMLALMAMTFSMAGFGEHYTRTDLTANTPATAPITDPNLVNAWGLSRSSGSPWWISDNGTGLSTLYNQTGAPQSLVVTIPPPSGQSGPSTPTGTVFNYTSEFLIPNTQAKSVFIFVTEDGTISGWNPTVSATQAVIAVDRSGQAIYKGCAIAQTKQGPRLFATNFQSGKVEAYDSKFKRINLGSSAFSSGSSAFVPFNIQNVGGNLVVTFAKKIDGNEDESHGPGLGRVIVFDVHGHELLSLQKGSWMNAPWGVALAPSDFGAFSHRLLIGNFGDGIINAFNAVSGKFEGPLLDANNKPHPIVIDGLWAISFGGGNSNSGALNELYFTSGPNDEGNGLFGKLMVADPLEQKGNSE
jgi:uncharacterized protein (TIGR03118 family)